MDSERRSNGLISALSGTDYHDGDCEDSKPLSWVCRLLCIFKLAGWVLSRGPFGSVGNRFTMAGLFIQLAEMVIMMLYTR
jgi:hypothetical protein